MPALDVTSRDELQRLVDAFISGEDCSLATANTIEVALDSGWPENEEIQGIVELLAVYRPGGGDWLVDAEEIRQALKRIKQLLDKV